MLALRVLFLRQVQSGDVSVDKLMVIPSRGHVDGIRQMMKRDAQYGRDWAIAKFESEPQSNAELCDTGRCLDYGKCATVHLHRDVTQTRLSQHPSFCFLRPMTIQQRTHRRATSWITWQGSARSQTAMKNHHQTKELRHCVTDQLCGPLYHDAEGEHLELTSQGHNLKVQIELSSQRRRESGAARFHWQSTEYASLNR